MKMQSGSKRKVSSDSARGFKAMQRECNYDIVALPSSTMKLKDCDDIVQTRRVNLGRYRCHHSIRFIMEGGNVTISLHNRVA